MTESAEKPSVKPFPSTDWLAGLWASFPVLAKLDIHFLCAWITE